MQVSSSAAIDVVDWPSGPVRTLRNRLATVCVVLVESLPGARRMRGRDAPPPASGRDADLPPGVIQGAKDGDEEAWRLLYDELHRPLLGYLKGKGAFDPENLLGEVFLRLAKSIGRFSGDFAQFRAYSYTIALNCVRDDARRRGARPDTVFMAPDELPGLGTGQSAESEALSELGLEAYRAEFAQLTPDQRQVLYLRVVADLSVEETARVVGKSKGSVKQLRRRALEQLRDSLGDTGVRR